MDPAGLEIIRTYVGRNPVVKTLEEAAAARGRMLESVFEGVPHSRWREEVERFFDETPEGLRINYDPDLARIFDAPEPEASPAPADFWPVFDCLEGLPLAAIRGANSDLLSPGTFAEMQRRRPDMIAAEVPGRGHVPFLDEPESVAAIRAWIDQCR